LEKKLYLAYFSLHSALYFKNQASSSYCEKHKLFGQLSDDVIRTRRKKYFKLRAELLPDWTPSSSNWFEGTTSWEPGRWEAGKFRKGKYSGQGIYRAFDEISDL